MWSSRRAVSLHVALGVFLPACVGLTWWQVSRALGGNTLSWVYTFEWPIFGAYATYMWWKLVHEDPVSPDAGAEDPVDAEVAEVAEVAPDGEREQEPVLAEDRELAAYNRYLAELNASGRQKRW